MHLSQSFCEGRFNGIPSKGVEPWSKRKHFLVIMEGRLAKQKN
jgi:hypothetical protein